MAESFLNGKVILHRGDCLEVLPTLEENSVDSVVCDPPYHLQSIHKRFAKRGRDETSERYAAGPYGRTAKGFMGKQWDGGGIAFNPETWALVLRVLKPGGHLLAFGGTRTFHRMACAIEDAGFEIRDQIGWCYGSGFPKSHDVSKGIDRLAGVQREVVGFDASKLRPNKQNFAKRNDRQPTAGAVEGWKNNGATLTAPATESAIQWQGWGTALKPAWEPIVLARKPLSESSIAANVLKWGTGAINVDACRIAFASEHDRKTAHDNALGPVERFKTKKRIYGGGKQSAGFADTHSPVGRWPANLIHDGSDEVVALFPQQKGGGTPPRRKPDKFRNTFGSFKGNSVEGNGVGPTSGSAARFFYTAKADTDDRLGSKHPTVKPLDLMQYLVRLVTPKGGVVLDLFAGTGTTGEAAWREGVGAILIEREPEYQDDIVKRMGLCLAGPDERRAACIEQLPHEHLPLFGAVP